MYAIEILRAEGLNDFATLDISLVSPTTLELLRRRRPRGHRADAEAGDDADELGQRRRELIALRPDKQLAGTARADRRRDDARRTRTSAVNTATEAGRRHRRADDPVPRHRRPLHPERERPRRHALLERLDRDHRPRGHAPLGRLERRPGCSVHVRPQPFDRVHAPGEPGVGGPEPRRRWRHPPERLFYGAAAGD